MAVVIAWRLAILVAPGAVRYANSASGAGAPGPLDLGAAAWRRLSDPAESDEALSSMLSDAWGSVTTVETIEGSFELRKAQIRYGRNSGEALGADDAVTTHHFVKLVSGSPVDTWDAADFIAAEARLLAFWNAIKANFDPTTIYKQVRWYRVGPGIDFSGPPVRVIDPAVAGTGTATTTLPPQVAMTITEKTTDPKSWGRFYLPAPGNSSVTPETGRLAVTSALADAADAMYEGFITDGVPAVVYSSAKAARETKSGTTLPAIGARALPVKQIQVDDLFDVVRSRRWKTPLLRVQRDVAGA